MVKTFRIMLKKSLNSFGKRTLKVLPFLTLLMPTMAWAQVSTSDAAWCEVMEQALADKGIEANVRSDMDGTNKVVHVTVAGETQRYVVPSASSKQDYSSPVYVIVEAYAPRTVSVGFGRDRMDGRMWMGGRSGIFVPNEVYTNPIDADALQANIRTAVSRVPRVTLVDGEFTSTALASDVPLLILKGDIIATQRGEQYKKPTSEQRGPRPVERWFAYAKIHVELVNYRTGEVLWTADLDEDNYSSMYSTDPMESVQRSITGTIGQKLASLYPASAPRMEVQGSILSIAEQQKKKAKSVYVNLGHANEIRKGDTFTVYAPVSQGNYSGTTPIGTLTVSEVQGDTLALCRVKKGGYDIYTYMQKGATLTVQSKW